MKEKRCVLFLLSQCPTVSPERSFRDSLESLTEVQVTVYSDA